MVRFASLMGRSSCSAFVLTNRNAPAETNCQLGLDTSVRSPHPWHMRVRTCVSALVLCFAASCGSDIPTTANDQLATLRFFNAFIAQVDVVVDGQYSVPGLATGSDFSVALAPGGHTLVIASGGPPVTKSFTMRAGASTTVAAVHKTNGFVAAAVLDDTGSVVPPGATKLRVMNLALGAGALQVYRTQPDYQTPVAWQIPFNYQSDPTSAPFYQSTVGSWELRVWTSPADASGWSNATPRVTIPLASGEKKTAVILDDRLHGGVRIELF